MASSRGGGWDKFRTDPAGQPWPAPVTVSGDQVASPVQEIPAGDFATNDFAAIAPDGLVTRGLCREDRRGIYACITDAGRTRYEAARPTHRRVLAETLSTG